jgi:hypothetical protein
MARRKKELAKVGTAYVLCFDPPYRHAAHYIGWTPRVEDRAREHMCGTGANLVAVATNAGCSFTLTREWPGVTRAFERSLKQQGGARRICPRCNPRPRAVAAAVARDVARREELGLAS